jgi:hypothetical protein
VSPAFSQGTSPKRSVPRYKLTVPLALTVLRSGIPNHIPGHDLEIGEGGMGVVRKCKSKYRQIESAASVTSPRPAFPPSGFSLIPPGTNFAGHVIGRSKHTIELSNKDNHK